MGQQGVIYKAHKGVITAFYAVLTAWTLISVPLIIGKFSRMDALWLIMIAFVVLFTWYWSLGLIYGIEIKGNQTLVLKSFRKQVLCTLAEIRRIEAPPSRIEIGFLRLRFAKNTYYMFFNYSDDLRKILAIIKSQNPNIQFVKFSPSYFKESYT